MEHCLFENSTLQSVVQYSYPESDVELKAEITEALVRRRGQKKAQQIMQHVFYGSLELDIFSSFDPRGEDSLVGLQRSLAATYVPHDQPDHKDLSPLLKVFSENAQGVRMGMHRYFWSEVYSANLFDAFLLHGNIQPRNELRKQFLDSEQVQTLGRELRKVLLDQGAIIDAESSLRKYNKQTLESPDTMFALYEF